MIIDAGNQGVFARGGKWKSEKVKKGKREKVLVVLLLTVAVMVACRSTSNVNSNSAAGPIRPMRLVTDDLGRKVTIPVNVERVVSTAPSVTENIFAVGAGDRLIGVTTFCNYPEGAKAIAKIGDTMSPNMESIIALKPDIVFVSTASQIEAFMQTLEHNGIAVYVTNPTSLEDVLEGLKNLGEIFGTEQASQKLSSELLDREIKTCSRFAMCMAFDLGGPSVRIVPVFVQISKEPLFTIGSEGFLNEVISEAGGESVTRDIETAFPKLSKETASALNPDAIILSDSEDNQEPNDAFKNSPAVKNGRVYKINADIISRPGPRLVDALEQIARHLHPEKFH